MFALTILLTARFAAATCPQDCIDLIESGYANCNTACASEHGTSAYSACHDLCKSQYQDWADECTAAADPTPPDCGRSSSTTSSSSSTTTTAPVSTTTTTLTTGSFVCTEVLGFSQTGMWYLAPPLGGGGFEPLVGDANWQLRAEASAGVDWQDPNYAGWTDPSALYSPCTSGPIDRVLLTISVPKGLPTVDWWVQNIRAEIATIRTKRPAMREIILQPVVGGPNNTVCYHGGQPVHASEINPTIDQAIAVVVNDAPDIVAGFSPEVRTCADFADTPGHLCWPAFDNCGSLNARTPIGQTIGTFYASFGG
jgi:hypothetical protein